MQIGISFFKSRIGRRFFILFLGCAFLPLVVLGWYSYQKVENQLYAQNMLRMEKDCKVYSMALMDRLVQMNNLIQIYASYMTMGQGTNEASIALHDQITPMIVGLGLYKTGSGLQTLSGHMDLESNVDFFDHLLHQQGKSSVYISNPDTLNRAVYLLVPFIAAGTPGLLVAQPESSLLWGVGVNSMLPSMTELAVYDEKGQIIISTQLTPDTALPAMAKRSANSNYLRFEYQADGKSYLAVGWSLFLKSHFNAQTWTIILSGTRSNILSPMLAFKQTFPLIIVLTLWIILFLSLFFIRKTLNPLAVLQQGTRRIANKDFASRVEISSGDEFQQLAESFNAMAGRLNKQFNTLALIDEIDRSILSSLDSSVIIPRSLRMISEFFSDQLVMLVQRTGDPNRMRLSILKGSHRDAVDEEYIHLSSEEQKLLFTGEPFRLLTRDVFMPRFLADRTTSDSVLFLPLDTERHVIGALILDFRLFQGQDLTEQIGQARQLADQLGIALANARLVSDLERLSLGTVEALARTVDAKSKWTAGHSERVSAIAVNIGRAMNWANEGLELLSRAGLLHDIGKIGIPVAVLDKPGKLNDEEYDIIKTHPSLSGKILEPIEVYRDILPLVVQHHERFDGKGYPEGLSGEDIDIGARILCVADVYDALISQRPYREGWIKENVLNFMRDNRGIMFDPDVVDILLSMDI
jgi:HD-GYP domain-containing protein (c-di-GMP phosphodiesterase class II)/HAMP domain-containing protein